MAAAKIDWEALARANTHPLRIRILELFAADPDAEHLPKMISVQIGIPLGNCAYHVKALFKSGLLRISSKHQRRGAMETRYRLRSH